MNPEKQDKETKRNLAATYSPARLQYHRREGVSLPCSGWERVSPPRHGRQKKARLETRESPVRPSGRPRDGNGNMVKPHGTLVPVG